MTLKDIHAGESCVAAAVTGSRALRHRLLSMGITPGVKITVKKTAPFGDPMEIWLRGYSLTLRKAEAAAVKIAVREVQSVGKDSAGRKSEQR